MKGTRLPFPADRIIPLLKPGEYMGPDVVELNGVVEEYWYGCAPNGESCTIKKGPWSITEHEDGTITVSPSIRIFDHNSNDLWHGYLERGVWRSC